MKRLNDNEKLLTVEELCQTLHIGKSTAMKLIKEKKVKAIKPGRRWMIPNEAVDLFIKKEMDKE